LTKGQVPTHGVPRLRWAIVPRLTRKLHAPPKPWNPGQPGAWQTGPTVAGPGSCASAFLTMSIYCVCGYTRCALPPCAMHQSRMTSSFTCQAPSVSQSLSPKPPSPAPYTTALCCTTPHCTLLVHFRWPRALTVSGRWTVGLAGSACLTMGGQARPRSVSH